MKLGTTGTALAVLTFARTNAPTVRTSIFFISHYSIVNEVETCPIADVPGASFSYSATYVQGDAVSTEAPSVGAVSNFSDQVSTAAGTAGDLAGTVTTAGVMTITAGGAGTSATGQFVNELTVQ